MPLKLLTSCGVVRGTPETRPESIRTGSSATAAVRAAAHKSSIAGDFMTADYIEAGADRRYRFASSLRNLNLWADRRLTGSYPTERRVAYAPNCPIRVPDLDADRSFSADFGPI